ncbi:cell division protease FtsH [Lachnospiraceae bacterium NE2001]|nr:cell division protease FtsH [Lachnospiraceae bacterium NE2001]
MRRGAGNLILAYALVGILFLGAWAFLSRPINVDKTYNDQKLKADVKEGKVTAVAIIQNEEIPTGTIEVTFREGETIYYTQDVSITIDILKNTDIEYEISDVNRAGMLEKLAPYIFITILFVVYVTVTSTQMASLGGSVGGGAGGNLANFGKSRAKKDLQTGITFNDVAGLDEEKEELAEIVDFLKDPGKYTEIGARIPKGIILEGPPGTGKTLLAKAVSGEAGVPFFSISGSDFVEMFVGVGASRVRDLFADAQQNKPCIVFIDEIDAVARQRGTGLGGGHDEREQTLNQLLVEMDGFGDNEGIIVMAATNRVDILDTAILRPGRFDRRVKIGRPDVKGREEILKVHTAKKPLSDDVNLHEIARTTAGFAGADLENLVNEAAIKTAKENRKFITKKDIDDAFVKLGIGTEKKSRVVSEKDRKITAYHESGHAILFHLLNEMEEVYTISIIPNGSGAGGYTMPLPSNDDMFYTRNRMLQNIQVSMGGRIAESLIFDDITTGASQDIKQATSVARSMVMKYGFAENMGFLNYEAGEGEEVFIGREIGHQRPYSEEVASKIDTEVKKIIDYCYNEAERILKENMDVLHKSAELLLEKEKITGAEFEALFA